MIMSNARSGSVAVEIATARAELRNKALSQQELQKAMRSNRDFIVYHELKIFPVYFAAVTEGRKRAEIRKMDRDFRVGDIIWMREFDPNSENHYTGQSVECRVTHIVEGGAFGILKEYCVLSFEIVASERMS